METRDINDINSLENSNRDERIEKKLGAIYFEILNLNEKVREIEKQKILDINHRKKEDLQRDLDDVNNTINTVARMDPFNEKWDRMNEFNNIK